jgi:hypothetical protein
LPKDALVLLVSLRSSSEFLFTGSGTSIAPDLIVGGVWTTPAPAVANTERRSKSVEEARI